MTSFTRAIRVAVLLLLSATWSAHAAGAGSIVSAPTPFAACAPEAGVAAFPNTVVEPSVAVHVGPRKLATAIAVWQQDRYSTAGALDIMAARQTSGRRGWILQTTPLTACTAGALLILRVSDPWVSIGSDGIVYVTALAYLQSTPGHGVWSVVAMRSVDRGATWEAPVVLRNSDANDKPMVLADPRRSQRAYAVWEDFETVWFARTVDGGKTWSPARTIPLNGLVRMIGNVLIAGSRQDSLYDFGEIMLSGTCYVGFVHSTNGGTTWSHEPHIVARDRSLTACSSQRIATSGLLHDLRTGARFPEPASDSRTGRIYVVWQDAHFSHGATEGVVMSTSGDQGTHWRPPIRVPSPAGSQAIDPAVAVDDRGRVAVAYYTVKARGSALPVDYWIAVSRDRGRHFTTPRRLSGPVDLRKAPLLFLGDYEGLAASGFGFQSVFAMPGPNGIDMLAQRVKD